jgi:cytochrome c
MRLRRAMIAAVAALAMTATGALADLDQSRVLHGKTEFKEICATCHTDEPNRNRIGPSLFGLIGRKSGTVPGFNYSDAMKNASIVWDEQSLDKYLADPKGVVPGTKMPYAGIKKPEARTDLITYLSTLR